MESLELLLFIWLPGTECIFYRRSPLSFKLWYSCGSFWIENWLDGLHDTEASLLRLYRPLAFGYIDTIDIYNI
jgi:hypothetical protein